MEKIIRGENITKVYGEAKAALKALDQVNLEVDKGEFLAVMGTSSSGKSTLLQSLSALDKVTEGKVYFQDRLLDKLNEDELSRLRRIEMGFIFQEPTFLKYLNILDNIILPSFHEHKKNRQALVNQAKTLMEKTGILGLEDRKITEISGGQLQRAGICRALLHKPKVIFADEPTGALNSKAADDVLDILSLVHQEGTTIVLVTHDPRVASRAGRVLLMRDGRIMHDEVMPLSVELDIDSRSSRISGLLNELKI